MAEPVVLQLAFPLGERPDPEHTVMLERHASKSWWRFSCACGVRGPWHERESQALNDADRHERKRRR